MPTKHTLYLIPTPIGKRKENRVLPEFTLKIIKNLTCFIVEKPQTSISFLRWINHPVPDFKMTLRILNKKTPDHEVYSYMKLLKEQDVGLMSEAGAPGVADPGSTLVKLAHENGFNVVPLVGPSSILLALMASGLNGQNFAFNGYLPIDEGKRISELQSLEANSMKNGQTQIFMETPHRNLSLFQTMLKTLKPSSWLCVACNLTQPDEMIVTKRIDKWKKEGAPELQKKPTLFLINAT
jgi:16S rRNA (cytidine1402-2'-O)-methyltransferase